MISSFILGPSVPQNIANAISEQLPQQSRRHFNYYQFSTLSDLMFDFLDFDDITPETV